MDTTFDMDGLTPKQRYEACKAACRTRAGSSADKELEMMNILDRFATAIERIADALERKS